ncbi:Adenosine monophosphate-transferase [Hyphodiscus hymeniophilus]|uniref:Adenosine monophosphate-transferase n=1 Tax=Hyphodiscus hymeniophilus TaxID=353542 RepID=A0A9P6SNN4_9HELO|nr:Adenosine monophosphate-transferase [Hyphodiscus hymeniophilus]
MATSPHKRNSIAGLFGGLNISKTTYKTINLPKALRNTIRAKLPSNAKLIWKMDPNYDYNRFTPDPDEVFEECVGYFGKVQPLIINLKDEDQSYNDYLVESMVMMIFTSNYLENAGSSQPITLRICKEIFAGRELPEEIGERDTEYEPIQAYLMEKKAQSDKSAVLRSRKQIIQHAYALKYITHRMVIEGEALSESLLKETHRILTDGIDADNEDKDKSETYGGIYRSCSVGWTCFSTFARPEDVPKLMEQAVAAFNTEVEEAISKQTLDPFDLATKYFHRILNIHPFLDGNSRLTRLMMNTILLKYVGIVIPIGRDSIEADKWKETVTRAAEIQAAEDEDRGGKVAWAEVSTLVAIQGRSTLRGLKDSLEAGKSEDIFERRKSIVGYHWDTSSEVEEEECYYSELLRSVE